MTSRILMAAVVATALATAPAFAQTTPTPTPAPAPAPAPAHQGAQQRPATAPAASHPAITGQPTPMPQLTFEEIVGDIPSSQTISPTAIAVGAVAGVIVFNMLAPTLFPATYMAGGPLAGTIVADTALAASRVYAVTSAAIGGWAGQWTYTNWLSR